MSAVETSQFQRRAADLLSDIERMELISYVASNPEAGDIMPGTGGVRKMRWGVAGRGKRGGARVVYYFYNETMPIFLLDLDAKNEMDNLSKAQRNEMRRLVPLLLAGYSRRASR